ncbi:MAG: peptidylprolyl isomerase [Spirochaetales bacterium]|nr:MAG: peptidylprolyl isomerase [Spirochaetales bacterium]
MKSALKAGAFLVTALSVLTISCSGQPKLPDGLYARIETVRGTVIAHLDFDKARLTVANFVGLAEGTLDATAGRHFYDGLTFHRVEKGFVIQGGDPMGDGTGDAGYIFPNEIHPDLRHDAPGVLGMASYAPDTNGSQFYITLDTIPYLDGRYTVFGRVVQGMDIVTEIQKGDFIKSIRILRIGDEAKAFRSDQAAWNALYAPAMEAIKNRKIAERAALIRQITDRWPDLEARPDGMLQKILKDGSGPTIRRFWLVNVAYKGMLPNGQVFDESSLHGGSIEFEVGSNQVIPGWDIIVSEMKKGEKRLVAIPPEYAYGSKGAAGGLIPPDSYLIFEIEITGYTE